MIFSSITSEETMLTARSFKTEGNQRHKAKDTSKGLAGGCPVCLRCTVAEKENKTNGEKQIKGNERERDCKRQRGLIALC